ncbi:MAG: 6-carboxytetrahydropterin synthase QueD [Chloroflexi bacterium RBG_13_56_8]|nr:MAG: 6-carboxytetrahydropterin synthase QueD [Chloroflexi bacterium RBG_13_56_8]
MYQVHVRRHFDAAHALRGYEGKCENLHGHRYEVVVCIEREGLDDAGLACDFTVLKRELDVVLGRYDHQNLNETPPFDHVNPSAENIARTIYQDLKERLPGSGLSYVEAWESPDAWATYSEDHRVC